MHPKTMFVKPREGLKVPDPDAQDFLPAEGRLVPRNGYWIRRKNDGDVTIAEQGVATKSQAQIKAAPAVAEKE